MKTKFIKIAFLIFTFSIFNFNFVSAQMFWNQACQFAGNSNSYVSVPSSSSINLTGSFTIEAWVKPSSLALSQGILSKGGSLGGGLEYGLRINSGGRILIATNGTVRLMSKTSTILSINNWSHIAATYNSITNSFAFYRNGVLDTSSSVASSSPPSNTDSLFIGISGPSTPFNGQLDEVRLWNKQLNATEVSQYFRTSLGATGGIYNGLVMSLTFQNNLFLGNDFSLFDWSGNNNVGFNRGVSAINQIDRPYITIIPNESVELDGNDDFLACPDESNISPTAGITLECWVYPRNTNPCIFLTKGTDYRLSFNGSVIMFVISNFSFSTGVGLPINQWSHVALSYSVVTDVYSFYLNGNLMTTASFVQGLINNGTDSLYIGGGPGFPDLNGFIDEVRISDYAKSQEEIYRYLYQSIENNNEPNPTRVNVVFNLDGLAAGSVNAVPRLFFRNNARFSHPGCIGNQPVSPLNRNDESGFSHAYYITTSNQRIPSSGTSGTISDSTTVNLNTTITDVNLFVALDHTSSSDLEVVLVAPNGDSVKVFDNKVTNSLDDNLITIFNDQADSSFISNRYSSFTPIIKPENNMNSVFNGDNSQGNWKLRVRDEVTNDIGYLYAWGIQFNNLSPRRKDLTFSGLLQGFYNASTNLMIPDTMRVYIRNSTSPFAILDSSKSLLNNSGLGLFSSSSFSIFNGSQYYIQLKHRNSIETWSNPFIFINNEASYSFIIAASAAFGSNQIQVDNAPVRFAIYGGDVDQNGFVDASDLASIDNDAFNFVTGYVQTDITGDEVVDGADAAIADNNAFNFVSVIRP